MKSNSEACDIVQSRLEIYSDGELSLSDRQELESHLEVCEICSDLNHRLQLLKKVTCTCGVKTENSPKSAAAYQRQ